MSNVVQMRNRDLVLEQASEWLARLDRQLTPDETVVLQQWLAEDASHAEMLMDIAELWDKMDSIARLTDLFPKPEDAVTPRFSVALAASVVMFALVLGVLAFNTWPELNPYDQSLASQQHDGSQVFQTGTGEQSTISLPDGSQLTLNTDSAIRFKYTSSERALVLERGEVHVQVAHDTTRPFNAYVGETFVQAVGTAFNLEITSDQRVELIVTEGKVLVGARQQALTTSEMTSNGDMPVETDEAQLVAAGQQLLLGQADEAIQELKPEEIDVKLSWQSGNLIFRGESLATAIAEIERYTTVEFVITDEKLKQVRVAGLFKAGDVEGLLQTLKKNFNVNFQRYGDEKIVLHSNENAP